MLRLTEVAIALADGFASGAFPGLNNGLDLSSNGIGEAGTIALAKAFKQSRALGKIVEFIRWTDNPTTPAAALELVQALVQDGNGSDTYAIQLEKTTGLDVGCCQAFSKAFTSGFGSKPSAGLHSLSLWGCALARG